jgi:hypothetical protein
VRRWCRCGIWWGWRRTLEGQGGARVGVRALGRHRGAADPLDAAAYEQWAARLVKRLTQTGGGTAEALVSLRRLKETVATAYEVCGVRLMESGQYSAAQIAQIMTEAGYPMTRQAVSKAWGPAAVAARAEAHVNVVSLPRRRRRAGGVLGGDNQRLAQALTSLPTSG